MTRQLPPIQRPQTLGGVVYFVVVAITVVGLLLVAFSDWRRGVSVIGGGLLLAALVRLFLGEYDAGMLRVRRRWSDIVMLVGTGSLLIFLAATIPDQPLR